MTDAPGLDAVVAWLSSMPPIDRARVAGVLVAHDTTARLAAIRRAAIYEATRTSSHATVAAALGVSLSAVNKAITEHNQAVKDNGGRATDATDG